MREETMEGIKVVQIFLNDNIHVGGIYEVSVTDDGSLVCSCPGFEVSKKSCKHIAYTADKVRKNHGVYPIKFSKPISEEEATMAEQSTELWREFYLKYGKIEVC
jgi:hypothetical protein